MCNGNLCCFVPFLELEKFTSKTIPLYFLLLLWKYFQRNSSKFWMRYIYSNFVPTPKQGTNLYFLGKLWETFKQLFEKKKERNFVSCRCVLVKQASVVHEVVDWERAALSPWKKKLLKITARSPKRKKQWRLNDRPRRCAVVFVYIRKKVKVVVIC